MDHEESGDEEVPFYRGADCLRAQAGRAGVGGGGEVCRKLGIAEATFYVCKALSWRMRLWLEVPFAGGDDAATACNGKGWRPCMKHGRCSTLYGRGKVVGLQSARPAINARREKLRCRHCVYVHGFAVRAMLLLQFERRKLPP